MASKKKSTRVVKESRVETVQKMLLEGQSRGAILRHAAQAWEIGDRQVDQYIHEASAWIDEANQNTAERNLALITTNLWEMFREHKIFTPNVARQALMDVARLRGLDKVDIDLNIIRTHKDASDEDLDKALRGK